MLFLLTSTNYSTHRDTEVMERLAWHQFIRIVVFIGREQFAVQLSVDVGECRQVKREACGGFYAGQPTDAVALDKTSTEARNIQVRKPVCFKATMLHSIRTSADTFISHILYK